MARERMRAAARKAADALAQHERPGSTISAAERADAVAGGVRRTCVVIADYVTPGSLWWVGPLQYVAEQMAPRVCRQHGVDPARADDVAAYLLGALQEYVHALAGEFDAEHCEAWTAALRARGG